MIFAVSPLSTILDGLRPMVEVSFSSTILDGLRPMIFAVSPLQYLMAYGQLDFGLRPNLQYLMIYGQWLVVTRK
jgi:hypothetical protein